MSEPTDTCLNCGHLITDHDLDPADGADYCAAPNCRCVYYLSPKETNPSRAEQMNMGTDISDFLDKSDFLNTVTCDHCSHPYKDHWYKRQGARKEAGCNSCFALDQECPGFHAGTVNVDLSPPCLNCKHTLGAHVISYKGGADDYCNVLECLCRKFSTADEKWEPVEKDALGQEVNTAGDLSDYVTERSTSYTLTVDARIPLETLIEELTDIDVRGDRPLRVSKFRVIEGVRERNIKSPDQLELTIE